MDTLTNFFNSVLTEQGTFCAFLLLVIVALVVAIRKLWADNKAKDTRFETLYNQVFSLLKNNTKVLTQLVERLKEHDD